MNFNYKYSFSNRKWCFRQCKLVEPMPLILQKKTRSFRFGLCEVEAPVQVPSAADQWNCSSSVEPVRAFTLDEPPWMTVVTSSK